jgi:hypothetical protein
MRNRAEAGDSVVSQREALCHRSEPETTSQCLRSHSLERYAVLNLPSINDNPNYNRMNITIVVVTFCAPRRTYCRVTDTSGGRASCLRQTQVRHFPHHNSCLKFKRCTQIATKHVHATNIMRSAVAVILLLCAASASAYPLIWAGISQDCSAIPANGYGPHEAPEADE